VEDERSGSKRVEEFSSECITSGGQQHFAMIFKFWSAWAEEE
jgi:hypothetical protein